VAGVLAAAGGVALFGLGIAVFFAGMAVMRRGVSGFAGPAVRAVLARLTRRPVAAAATGLVLTLALQSSSLVTVVLMEFADAGLVSFPSAVAVVVGGNVGAALTVQFLALRLYDLALPIVALGLCLRLAPVRMSPRLRAAGTAVVGFGILYLGIALVTASAAPLTTAAAPAHLLLALGRSPLGAGVFGCVLTALVQSNGIANGLLLQLGRQGLLPLSTAAAVIAGANVGSGALALIASIPGSRLDRRLAVANALINVAGLLWVIPAFPLFVSVAGFAARDAAQALANAHILFNVLASATLLPVVGAFSLLSAWLSDRVFPAPATVEAVPWPRPAPPAGRSPVLR